MKNTNSINRNGNKIKFRKGKLCKENYFILYQEFTIYSVVVSKW